MQLGTVVFNGIGVSGKKHEFRFNSEAEKIHSVFFQMNNINGLALNQFLGMLDGYSYKNHLFYVSLLVNNSKDRILTDIPIDRQLFQYVSDWSSNTDFKKYIKSDDFFISVNKQITPNTNQVAVIRIAPEFLSLRNSLSNTNKYFSDYFMAQFKLEMIYQFE